jgi:hypothetical protein
VYGIILKLSERALKEVLPFFEEKIKGPKRVRGKMIRWKCSEYTVPICRPEEPY